MGSTSGEIGGKDTRETRRAVIDALLFLKAADEVSVVEICAKDELESVRARLKDVVSWLGRHKIMAEPLALPSMRTDDEAKQLETIARDQAADLLVGGAYGHSRLREWILGGVTRDLLLRPERCAFISH